MPFKTKRQKLSAAERRFTFSEDGAVVYKGTSERIDASSGSISSVNLTKTPTSNSIEDISYIAGDLLKIGLCALVVIGGQVALRLTLP